MTLTPERVNMLAKMPATDPFYEAPLAGPDLIDVRDQRLKVDLWTKVKETPRYFSEETGLTFDNFELSQLARKDYSSAAFSHLECTLDHRGTSVVPMLDGFSVTVDGKPRDITIVTATELTEGISSKVDMLSMLYLRDHVQTASMFIDLGLLDPAEYEEKAAAGRTLLFSALHLMSTRAQLERFQNVIKRGNEAGQADWPHISLHFNDMDATAPDNKWRNKQDTFQMLAYTTLDAIDRGFIDVSELDNAHKQFLGSVVPLLAAVKFPHYENSGSWEEIEARRTSVMSIETALLHKIKKMRDSGQNVDFLEDHYNKTRIDLPKGREEDFTNALDRMLQSGLEELGKRLPYESPDYSKDSIKYREADAALMYVLMYDIPELLAEAEVPVGPSRQPMTRRQIEDMVFDQIVSLLDPETNCADRYEKDSYQRVDFHTHETQQIITDIKNEVKKTAEETGQEIDLDKKQILRGERTPNGKQAAWIHPLGQIAGGYAAKQCLKAIGRGDFEESHEYRSLSIMTINDALSNVTGEEQYYVVLGENNEYIVKQAPPYRLPECKVAFSINENEHFLAASSNTPLNWASATVMHAVGLTKIATKKLEAAEHSAIA